MHPIPIFQGSYTAMRAGSRLCAVLSLSVDIPILVIQQSYWLQSSRDPESHFENPAALLGNEL